MQPSSVVWRVLEFYGTQIKHRGKWRVHGLLRNALHATSDCDLEVKRQGLNWCLNPSDFVQTHLYWTGEYEPWDVYHLSQWLCPNAVFLDVGANFGYYSIRLASMMHMIGHVYAFEPSRATFSRLCRNIALNRFGPVVTPMPVALSERKGFASLNEFDGNSGATRISGQNKGETIELDTLDCFCEANQITRVDIMKVDVEGSEVRVIEGGNATLSRYRPVMMVEFNSSALEEAGTSGIRLDGLLRGLGYQLFKAERERLIPFHLTPNMIANVFCIPESRIVEIERFL